MTFNKLGGYIMLCVGVSSLTVMYSLIEYWFNIPSWKVGVIVCLFFVWSAFWDSGISLIRGQKMARS